VLSPLSADTEARGLSALLLPGILVLSAALKDRVDSFVSALLNDGYESRLGPGPVGVWEPELLPSLEGVLPMMPRQLHRLLLVSSMLLPTCRRFLPLPFALLPNDPESDG
jgi:hypothetical protein